MVIEKDKPISQPPSVDAFEDQTNKVTQEHRANTLLNY